MPPVKPIGTYADKWKRKSVASTQDYTDGVQGTNKSWAANTTAAAENFKVGVTAAANAGRFEAGVAKAGDAKWKAMTIAKGPARWSQGIGLAGDAYARAFEPFRQVIESTTLPPRGTRGSPQNYERSRVMGEALHQARVG